MDIPTSRLYNVIGYLHDIIEHVDKAEELSLQLLTCSDSSAIVGKELSWLNATGYVVDRLNDLSALAPGIWEQTELVTDRKESGYAFWKAHFKKALALVDVLFMELDKKEKSNIIRDRVRKLLEDIKRKYSTM